MSTYDDFLKAKVQFNPPTGLTTLPPLPSTLFPHQDALVKWALRRGRSAIFADTGLGKMRMELVWSDIVRQETRKPVLMLTPLAVAPQVVAEAGVINMDGVVHAREQSEAGPITVTNYDRLHLFDASKFGAVVLDESSIIKNHTAKTLQQLNDAFVDTPFKLPASATPSPNDWTELGTHAEFLGVCTRAEMLAEYFVHDGGDTQTWRLKGHAREQFWRWVSSWGAMVRRPSDLGFDDSLYQLPPLHIEQHTVGTSAGATDGRLFALEAQTLSERRDARKASLMQRCEAVARMVNADKQPWIVWTELNVEGDVLKRLIPGAVEVRGSDPVEHKEKTLADFAAGRIRVLISKPSICGWGLNWQFCRRIAFAGASDSWEAFYQAIRRCWRFGQIKAVFVHVFASAIEGAVVANLKRKEADAVLMAEALASETRAAVMEAVLGLSRETNPYHARAAVNSPSWLQSEAA